MAASILSRLKGLCVLCQQQSYARRKALFYLRTKRISSKPATSLREENQDNKDSKSTPSPRSFPSEIKLDSAVAADLENEVVKHRRHPGIVTVKTVQLPSVLEEAANNVVHNYSTAGHKPLQQKAEILQDLISTRVAPIEKHEYKKKTEKIYSRLMQQELQKKNRLEVQLEEEKALELHEKLEKRAILEAGKAGFTWKPIIFNAETGLVYMVARLAQNYSVLLQIFNEIKMRDPSFVPGAIYNFGSGIGSVIWGANSVWHNQIFEYYCVDQSGYMNTLARLLLQGGSENKKMCIQGVYFRQFHSSDKATYKMVVCAYTLLELGSRRERIELLTSLWNKTEEYLVLVEVGNAAGFKLMIEARDHILSCTHDTVCPKLEYNKMYCNFRSSYKPLHLGQGPRREDKQIEKYSYLVLKKGPRQEETSWPRFVHTLQQRHNHIHCHLCCPDGSLRHTVVTKNQEKYSKHLYKCVKKSQWGDRLPVMWPKDLEESTETNYRTSEKDNELYSETDESFTEAEENFSDLEQESDTDHRNR